MDMANLVSGFLGPDPKDCITEDTSPSLPRRLAALKEEKAIAQGVDRASKSPAPS